MASYKKKGYKKVKVQGGHTDDSFVAKSFESVEDLTVKSEKFLERHQNKIFTGIFIIALLVAGYYFYHQKVVIPKRAEAANALYPAQSLFEQAVDATDEAQQKQLFEQALKGTGGKYGLLDVIDEYGGTPSGNLAHYYAGLAYYHLGQFDKAVSELSKFKSDDEVLHPMALGVIGDSFLQLNQPEDALEYYEKAVKASDNEFTAPMYLFKAGKVALDLYQSKKDDKYLKKARKYLERIDKDYPKSVYAKDAKIYLAQAQYGKQ
ncbi:MAG: tetratricopeptide repeat protein [Chlorobi bacterium]|nr:tetratricopeptide repeat protein [Chlorobiota bacterium]